MNAKSFTIDVRGTKQDIEYVSEIFQTVESLVKTLKCSYERAFQLAVDNKRPD